MPAWAENRSRQEPDPLNAKVSTDDRSRPDWCTVMLAPIERRAGEFQVVTLASDRQRHLTARSALFRLPRSSRIPNRGAARAAH
jgi:hypothetical protein